MGQPIFEDCVFFLKLNLSFKEKKQLKSNIIANGGTISFVLNQKCTHVIVNNSKELSSSHLKKIQKFQIDVVNIHSVWKSIEDQQKLTKADSSDIGQPKKVIKETVTHIQDIQKTLPSIKTASFKDDTTERFFDDENEVDDADESHFTQNAEVAKFCFLESGPSFAFVEILCSQECHPFPFRISSRLKLPNELLSVSTYELDAAEKACEKYETCIKNLKDKGFIPNDDLPQQAASSASQTLQMVLLQDAMNVTKLDPEVGYFVEYIWLDALGHLDNVLSCPVNKIGLNDVSKAEGILRQVRNAMDIEEKSSIITEMMSEFYRLIPHKERHYRPDKKLLTTKWDLCQLIRDMVNICETNLYKIRPSSLAKYQALRCSIENVDPNTEEFLQVKNQVLQKNHSNQSFEILKIYRIGRLSETTEFQSKIGKIKPLLHASSACNFVGILSRGLLLPKVIVEDHGLKRTDIGNLGSGIYFSDSISTSFKYTEPSENNGSRLLVVCDVALGTPQKRYKRDISITEAPNGFHSVYGVRKEHGIKSDFEDDEFVVYNRNQVKMRYIVQFYTSEDKLNLVPEKFSIENEQTEESVEKESQNMDEDIIEDLPEEKEIKGGLQSSTGIQIPLEGIHVKARIMDLLAQVVVFQTYKNNISYPIEAKYVFPLDSTAAVCGFEAFINGKHIVGEVKEKKQAHKEYRTAIREGHGAYLMDQDAPDVFTVSVGNLPPNATVIIKITYIMELEFKYGLLRFYIPGKLASWQQDKALQENTQDTVTKICVDDWGTACSDFCLDMSIEMPYEIEEIMCTHEIKKKKTDCKAVIQTGKSTLKDYGFTLTLSMKDMYLPRMWVEKHPDQDSEACLLVFQPNFDNEVESGDVTICLDCSNSMESSFQDAKLLALLAIPSLTSDKLNFITFGTKYKEFSLYPKLQTDISQLKKFIKSARPNMGSTEFWKPLHSLSLLLPSTGVHKVLLISDGHIQNEGPVFQILKKNAGKIRLFTCGVGGTANRHMLRSLSQHGAGAFEFFEAKSKSSWEKKMDNQIERVLSPACSSVSVKWKRYNVNSPDPVQAPTHIQALFSSERLLVYGFVPDCTQATLTALIKDQELDTMVSTTELQKTTGTMLHKLTARAIIRDYEDGLLHEKEDEHEMKKQLLKSLIVELSKKYSIVTQFTSFVAVEKRDSKDSQYSKDVNILEIISTEDVDILPYMAWETSVDDSHHYEDKSLQQLDILEDSEDGSCQVLGMLAASSDDLAKESEDSHHYKDKSLQQLDYLEASSDDLAKEYEPQIYANYMRGRGMRHFAQPPPPQPACHPYLSSQEFNDVARKRNEMASSDDLAKESEPQIYANNMRGRGMRHFAPPPPPPPPPPACQPYSSAQEFNDVTRNKKEMIQPQIYANNMRGRGMRHFAPPPPPPPPPPACQPYSSAQEFNDVTRNKKEMKIFGIQEVKPPGYGTAGAPSSAPFQIFGTQEVKPPGYGTAGAPSSAPFQGFGAPGIGTLSAVSAKSSMESTVQQKIFGIQEVKPPGYGTAGAPSSAPFQIFGTQEVKPPGYGTAGAPSSAPFQIFGTQEVKPPGYGTAGAPSSAPFRGFGAPGIGTLSAVSAKSSMESTVQQTSPLTSSTSGLYSVQAFEAPKMPTLSDVPTMKPMEQLFGFQEKRTLSAPSKRSAGGLFSASVQGFGAPGMGTGLDVSAAPPTIKTQSFGALGMATVSDVSVEAFTTKPKQMYGFHVLAQSNATTMGGTRAPFSAPFQGIYPGDTAWGPVAAETPSCHVERLPPVASSPGAVNNSRARGKRCLQPPGTLDTQDPNQDLGAQKMATVSDHLAEQSTMKSKALRNRKSKSVLYRRAAIIRTSVSWESLSTLQSLEGYWMMTPNLGQLLNLDVNYLTNVLLFKKGICSLGVKGKEEILKLIATLLVLQIIRTFNLLDLIMFKSLLHLHDSSSSSPFYQNIEKAIKWARKADQQHSGICIRLGLGKDWDSATRTILKL
ncbi:protein mono-ADP-ribosyltransferase PARP4 isoform 2-T2 [Discoglossus pictus]